jgi:cytochrome c553
MVRPYSNHGRPIRTTDRPGAAHSGNAVRGGRPDYTFILMNSSESSTNSRIMTSEGTDALSRAWRVGALHSARAAPVDRQRSAAGAAAAGADGSWQPSRQAATAACLGCSGPGADGARRSARRLPGLSSSACGAAAVRLAASRRGQAGSEGARSAEYHRPLRHQCVRGSACEDVVAPSCLLVKQRWRCVRWCCGAGGRRWLPVG